MLTLKIKINFNLYFNKTAEILSVDISDFKKKMF